MNGVLALLLLCAQQNAAAWLDDYDAGLAAAQAAGKDMLVEFTGSDWCAPCRRLGEQVLDTPEFLALAGASCVLVRLDYPRSPEAKALVPHPERNAAIAQAWAVSSFPTLVLAAADGEPYAETGDQDLTPAKFWEDLQGLRSDAAALRPQLATLEARLRGGKDVAAAARASIALLRASSPRLRLRESLLPALRGARAELAATEPALEVDFLRLLLELRRATNTEEEEAIAKDPDNETGLYEQVMLARLSRVQFVAEMEAFNHDLERFVALDRYHDASACSHMLVQSSRFYHNYLARPQGARLMAGRARRLGAVAPEDEAWLRKMLGS